MVSKLGNVVTYHEETPPIKSFDKLFDPRVFKISISTTAVSMATELGMMLTYLMELLAVHRGSPSYYVIWLLSHEVLKDHLTN